ncbi:MULTISPECIES: Bug family tripartite tricarboxylate transporter substrate binding protein [Roseomonadaceae]|uniref:Tripartite tricarboxylate transporter substrate binding protein n=1 Tax=Falsiroseomonas oleicola TaxID=2801474 RepID=A0ABS6H6E4_9PROT|nr:tripartite tricarboxylate transporter substrate-binding protein [Roseomonas oleicola]MBU8544264.1 tripartite tricarboxylate transporter substrate binding protein [Roseomonas oleicola]
MTTRRILLAGLSAAPALAMPGVLRAQGGGQGAAYPSRTVTIVVPFPPGGGTDVLARILAQNFQESWRQSVIVENRGGGAGRIGLQMVQRAQPDGFTLLVTSTGGIMGLAGAGGDTAFKVRDQLTPVTMIAAPAYVIAMHPGVGAKNVGELVALAKQRPGHFTFGSSGTGAASHLAAELFCSMAGIEMLHVPYRGTGPALTDLIAGRIHLMFAPPQTVAAAVAANQVVNLAVTSERASALLPGVPPASSTGLPGYAAVGWFGLFGPRGMPEAVTAKVAADAATALGLQSTRDRLATLGAEPEPMTPDVFTGYIDADIAKWQRVVRERNITLE